MFKQHFAESIPYFQESADFFAKHPMIDRLRAVFLLSPSKFSYREMALCNIAFAHAQLGNGREAKEMYQQVLAEYPENGLASVALKLIRGLETRREA